MKNKMLLISFVFLSIFLDTFGAATPYIPSTPRHQDSITPRISDVPRIDGLVTPRVSDSPRIDGTITPRNFDAPRHEDLGTSRASDTPRLQGAVGTSSAPIAPVAQPALGAAAAVAQSSLGSARPDSASLDSTHRQSAFKLSMDPEALRAVEIQSCPPSAPFAVSVVAQPAVGAAAAVVQPSLRPTKPSSAPGAGVRSVPVVSTAFSAVVPAQSSASSILVPVDLESEAIVFMDMFYYKSLLEHLDSIFKTKLEGPQKLGYEEKKFLNSAHCLRLALCEYMGKQNKSKQDLYNLRYAAYVCQFAAQVLRVKQPLSFDDKLQFKVHETYTRLLHLKEKDTRDLYDKLILEMRRKADAALEAKKAERKEPEITAAVPAPVRAGISTAASNFGAAAAAQSSPPVPRLVPAGASAESIRLEMSKRILGLKQELKNISDKVDLGPTNCPKVLKSCYEDIHKLHGDIATHNVLLEELDEDLRPSFLLDLNRISEEVFSLTLFLSERENQIEKSRQLLPVRPNNDPGGSAAPAASGVVDSGLSFVTACTIDRPIPNRHELAQAAPALVRENRDYDQMEKHPTSWPIRPSNDPKALRGNGPQENLSRPSADKNDDDDDEG